MASTHRDEISRLELLHAAHPEGLVFPHLADAYRRAGRYSQAESILSAGLRRHADYASAHVVMGRLRLDQGKREEARSAFQRVLRLDPRNQVALEYMGEMAAEDGRTDEAITHFRTLQRLKPDAGLDARISELEGRSSGGDPDRAGRPAGNGGGATASPRMPEPGEVVTETMAELYARQGLFDRAAAVYRQLLQAAPGDARLLAKLDQVERRHGARPTPPAETSAQPLERTPPPEPSGQGRPTLVPDATDDEEADRAAPAEPGPADAWAEPEPGPADAWVEPEPEPEAGAPEGLPEVDWVEQLGAVDWAGTVEEPEEVEEPALTRPWAAPADRSGRPIATELNAMLAWRPARRPARRPETEAADPWAEAPVSPVQPAQRMPAQSVQPAQPMTPTQPVPPAPPVQPVAPAPDEPAAGFAAPPPAAVTSYLLPGQKVEGDGAESGEEEAPLAGAAAPSSSRVPPGLVIDDGLGRFEGVGVQMKALLALSDLLVGLLEYRDPFFRGSSSLTRLLATSVAEEMGLGPEEQVELALAAVLRDLGRLALGGRLLPVPRLNPTGESLRKIERHVDLALHLLEGIDLPPAVRQAVRHHHERWDGAGYPDALSGENIPVLARILAVVDSFAAMVSPRPYRLPRKVPDAAAELEQEGGTRYDPAVVAALLRVIARREQPHLGFVQRHHILLVNPDQAGSVVSAAKLCSAGYLAEVMGDATAARERLRRVPVAALVISAEAGEAAASDFVRDLRADPAFGALPIVVVDAESVALRVRLLESGADVCFPPGISHAELQGTLGALVRRTLRSEPRSAPQAAGGDSTWLALQGDIQDFPLTWLLQVMKYDSRTAAIGIRTDTREGAIYLSQGDAVHAQIRDGGKGEPALREMLQWRKGRFTVQPDARPREQTIRTSIMHLLLTQAVAEDHAAAGIFGAVEG